MPTRRAKKYQRKTLRLEPKFLLASILGNVYEDYLPGTHAGFSTYQFLHIRIFETQPTMTDATNNTIVEIVAPEATPRILLVLGWEIAFKNS